MGAVKPINRCCCSIYMVPYAIVIANSVSTLKAWSSVHALKCMAIHCCTFCAFHVSIGCLLLSLNCLSELTNSRLSQNGQYMKVTVRKATNTLFYDGVGYPLGKSTEEEGDPSGCLFW